LRIRSSKIARRLSANQSPVSHLANGEAVGEAAFQSDVGLIGFGPEGALNTETEGAYSVELVVDQPVVSSYVPSHYCLKATEAQVGVIN
jgi:hypothetical protein